MVKDGALRSAVGCLCFVAAAMAASSFKSRESSFASFDSSSPTDAASVYLRAVSAHSSLLSPFLSSSEETGGWPAVILDGAGGSELERLTGGSLHPLLWSAGCVTSERGLQDIRAMHWSYLNAGADVITAVSYQASPYAFQRALQVTDEEAAALMRLTAQAAVHARDQWWLVHSHHQLRERPLVAASIGSFGALMAGGEEYTGDYGDVDLKEVEEVQRERIRLLADVQGVDLLLLETLPNMQELQTLLTGSLPDVCPSQPVVVSLSSADGHSMRDGTPLSVAFAFILDHAATTSSFSSPSFPSSTPRSPPSSPVYPSIIGVGVNCCSPDHAESAMGIARRCVIARWNELTEAASPSSSPPSLPLLWLYPNSGEEWDPVGKGWSGQSEVDGEGHSQRIVRWYESGARVVGGCCRTGPAFIHQLRRVLLSSQEGDDVEQHQPHAPPIHPAL